MAAPIDALGQLAAVLALPFRRIERVEVLVIEALVIQFIVVVEQVVVLGFVEVEIFIHSALP
jgi:hypothetical protein